MDERGLKVRPSLSQNPMPSKRLLTMGLLDQYPTKSRILTRFVTNGGKWFSPAQIQSMVALYHTPGIPKSWMEYQFDQHGLPPRKSMKKLRRFALNPEYRAKWQHLGDENITMIGQPEVERFYARRNPNKEAALPAWAVAIFLDHQKQGMSRAAIAAKYNLSPGSLKHAMKRGIFVPLKRQHPPPIEHRWKTRKLT